MHVSTDDYNSDWMDSIAVSVVVLTTSRSLPRFVGIRCADEFPIHTPAQQQVCKIRRFIRCLGINHLR